jgi:diguanylate cyclase (GGDEF)-like protein
MRELRPAARLYLGGVLALAASLAIVGTILVPARQSSGAIAAVILACATLAQQFKVKSPKHQSYYTTTIFFTGAAILLQPLFVVLIVVAAHAVEAIRVRQRWYIQAFNVANFVTCSLVSSGLFHLAARADGLFGPRALLAAASAGIVFVLLNHVLTALVIMWARGVPLSRTGTLDWDNIGTDLALMSVGILAAILWLSNPFAVPLALCPLFLIYRSLMVPTLRQEARTDTKTALANMKHWNEVASLEIERAGRFKRPLSVVLADLDLLREVNNRHGHLAGDQMIRRVADAIRGVVREYDLPARFGGDEFAILMPEAGLEEATAVAERLRQAVAAIELKTGDSNRVAVTISIGLAVFPAHGRTPSEMLAAADRAVYQAKALGRNRVCAFGRVEAPGLRLASASARRAA